VKLLFQRRTELCLYTGAPSKPLFHSKSRKFSGKIYFIPSD